MFKEGDLVKGIYKGQSFTGKVGEVWPRGVDQHLAIGLDQPIRVSQLSDSDVIDVIVDACGISVGHFPGQVLKR
jgi:hypothetical protein